MQFNSKRWRYRPAVVMNGLIWPTCAAVCYSACSKDEITRTMWSLGLSEGDLFLWLSSQLTGLIKNNIKAHYEYTSWAVSLNSFLTLWVIHKGKNLNSFVFFFCICCWLVGRCFVHLEQNTCWRSSWGSVFDMCHWKGGYRAAPEFIGQITSLRWLANTNRLIWRGRSLISDRKLMDYKQESNRNHWETGASSIIIFHVVFSFFLS